MKNKMKMMYEAPAIALERWNPAIKAKKEDDASINIYSTIGEYGDGSGMTARIVSAILRKADGADVTVNINSPGGDFFEGLAIHSLLSGYKGNVKVKVLGMAASAASVVALAGDEVEIAESGFFMIHNAWTIAIGNRHDMEDTAGMLGKFDSSMKGLYATKTGMSEKEIEKLMDAETWINGRDSVEKGFANKILGEDEIEEGDEETQAYAIRKLDVTLAKAGMPRSERRALLKEITAGTPSAADEPTPCAGLTEALSGLLETVRS